MSAVLAFETDSSKEWLAKSSGSVSPSDELLEFPGYVSPAVELVVFQGFCIPRLNLEMCWMVQKQFSNSCSKIETNFSLKTSQVESFCTKITIVIY